MAIMRTKEMRELNIATLDQKLEELSQELSTEKGTVASGGKASNPGRMKELRRTIARALTVKKEMAGKQAREKTEPAKQPSKKEKS